jgi:hypothetical protein
VFDITDMFALGLGCDLAGGYLLARGLLRSPRAIRRRATYNGIYPGGLIDDAEDRVVASIGIWALLGGFGVQALAYTLVLGFGSSSSAGSLCQALVGVAATGVPLAAILGAEAATHRHRVDAVLVRAAHEDPAAGVTRDEPDVEMLARVAEYRAADDRRYGRRDDEGDLDYVRRIFRVG